MAIDAYVLKADVESITIERGRIRVAGVTEMTTAVKEITKIAGA